MRATKDNILNYLKEIKYDLEKMGVTRLALFGSFAIEKQNVYSDIDIAIVKEKKSNTNFDSYDYFELINFIKEKVRQKFHRNVDIFDLDSKSSFKKSIEKELIYV